MKILITGDVYQPTINGVVTSVINLKEGLETLGAEVKVLTLSNSKESYSEGDVYFIGSIDMGLLYPGVRLRMKNGRKEIQELLDWKPDVIHTQCEFSTFSLAKRIAKELSIPIIHTYHTIYEDYTHYFSPSKKLGKKAVSRITKHIGSCVSAIIAPTKKTESILECYGVSCPVKIIPSGISLENFQEKNNTTGAGMLREKLNIPEDRTVLVSVSRVSKEKNIAELIDCVKHLNNKKITLVIVGDGPERETLEQMVETMSLSDAVKFTGMIPPDEVPQYYQIADLFVSASTSETQGLTYIEALASGIPILCREDDCLEDILLEGVNGYRFTDRSEFIEKLDTFIGLDSCEKMKEAALMTAEKYSKRAFAESVRGLYFKVIQENKEQILQEENGKSHRRLLNILTGAFMLLLTAATVYGYQQGYFTSIEELQKLITMAGISAPAFFIFIQLLQVIFPFIPAGLGCLAGIILFGPVWGFIYNYVGIVIGSLITFGLSKTYGKALIAKLFPKSITMKYFKWVEKEDKFKKWFTAAMISPISPGDVLCYIAGTTKMKWKEYTAIILLARPFSIAIYGSGLAAFFNLLVA